jgi:hypothetical protein
MSDGRGLGAHKQGRTKSNSPPVGDRKKEERDKQAEADREAMAAAEKKREKEVAKANRESRQVR